MAVTSSEKWPLPPTELGLGSRNACPHCSVYTAPSIDQTHLMILDKFALFHSCSICAIVADSIRRPPACNKELCAIVLPHIYKFCIWSDPSLNHNVPSGMHPGLLAIPMIKSLRCIPYILKPPRHRYRKPLAGFVADHNGQRPLVKALKRIRATISVASFAGAPSISSSIHGEDADSEHIFRVLWHGLKNVLGSLF